MHPCNFHYLLHMENISCRVVSGAVAPHIHWINSCSTTFMPHSWSLGLGITGTGDRKCLQMTALSVEHGSHASTGILTWYKLVWLHLPVPSADDSCSACKWFIHWTSDDDVIKWKLFLYYWPFVPPILYSSQSFLARGMLPGNFVWRLKKNPFIPKARHSFCCTCTNQKSERAYWFHRNSR